MQKLTLESLNEMLDEQITMFVDQATRHSVVHGYHHSPGQGMDIGWIDCARHIKQIINEEFKEI